MLRQTFGLALCILACSGSATKPKITFYAESLCPYCKGFALQPLARLFKTGIAQLADVELVPWGNARMNSDGSWTCQHGELECAYNTLMSCAIKHYPEQEQWFPYVSCIFASAREESGKNVRSLHTACAMQALMDAQALWTCYSGPEGHDLQVQAYQATAALKPPHLGVPWVTVSSQIGAGRQAVPLYDATDYVSTIVCAAYTGTDRLPSACYEEQAFRNRPYSMAQTGSQSQTSTA